MGDAHGFKKFERMVADDRPVPERIRDYKEIPHKLSPKQLNEQGARCMDCGIPFCHTGCPLGNIIPDFNDLVFRDRWREALDRLHATNNFPEFTGRVCPAPCETACVLGITSPPVTIKQIEKAIIDRGWAEGWVVPEPPRVRTGKKVAVIGAGPSGLACAQQLNRAGHTVTLFERADRPGGLLMYGIPDFKMEKTYLYKRIKQMEAEGVVFRCGVNVGKEVTADQLRGEFDAVVLTIGATAARELPIPGRDLRGIHLAMEFLPQQNKVVAGDIIPNQIVATGKHVVVIGGGDTGSDCIGTSVRQGAVNVTQIELLDRPPDPKTKAGHNEQYPWPYYPMVYRTSTSQAEGCERKYSINTRRFEGDAKGNVSKLHMIELEWTTDDAGRMKMREIEGSEFEIQAELVLLAMGFVGPEKAGIVADLGVDLDPRGNIVSDANYMTSVQGVFAAGDSRRGQSLVVWALAEGREAARGVDLFLMGHSDLPTLKTRDESLPRYTPVLAKA